ncbi:ABC transporter permease [bacterium]|nr:ABC transporter permease [bacterium]
MRKLQSALSVLGIVFGVAAVIVAVSIGEGARRELLEAIELMGINNLSIRQLSTTEIEQSSAGQKYSPGLMYSDSVKLISKIHAKAAGVAPVKFIFSDIAYSGRTANARVAGTVAEYLDVYDLIIKEGRFLVKSDREDNMRVCIIGMDIKQRLFPFESPIGKMINIRSEWYRVVGWLDNKDTPRIKGDILKPHDTNIDIYIPLETAFISMPEGQRINEIIIRAADTKALNNIEEAAESLLLRTHNGVRDYKIIIPRELLRQGQQTRRTFNIVMACIAGISLLIGGIGIMNIMLATVTERTREIGIRRAMGASRRDIVHQFLTESVMLTLTGGIVGIISGIVASWIVSWWVQWKTAVAVDAVCLAFIISVIVGIAFGIYPAYRGAMMDPVKALRYD